MKNNLYKDSFLVKKNTLVLYLITFSQQFLSIKFSLIGPALFIFLSSSFLNKHFPKPNFKTIFLFSVLGLSTILSVPIAPNLPIQFSSLFAIISLIMWIACIVLIKKFRSYKLSVNDGYFFLLNLIICFLLTIIISPSLFLSPEDGPIGFFNEKGIFCYFISLLSLMSFTALKKKHFFLSWIQLLIVFYYTIFVQEVLRCIILYVAFFLISSLKKIKLNYKTIIFLSIFSCILLIFFFSNSFEMLIYKLNLMINFEDFGEDLSPVGRYASSLILFNSSFKELLLGNGFGNYQNIRAEYFPFIGTQTYDYAGSFLIEMILEIGIIGTTLIFYFLSNFIFPKNKFFGIFSLLILSFSGGKQDIQFIFSVLCLYIFNNSIEKS